MGNFECADTLRSDELVGGRPYSLGLAFGETTTTLPFVVEACPLSINTQWVVLRSPDKLEVLQRLGAYPGMAQLIGSAVDAAPYVALENRLDADIFIFGAHQVGVLLARLYTARGGSVRGFIDNDPAKHGTLIDGIPVAGFDPDKMAEDALIVLGSGRHSVAIERDLRSQGWTHILTMHQFLAAMDTPYIAEPSFRTYRQALIDQPLAVISAFMCLDDERSRQVFDGLVSMRLNLTNAAPGIRSDYRDEYMEPDFINAADLRHYVDAGAYNGDTLLKFEARLAAVETALLFEPERLAFLECQQIFAPRPGIKVLQAAMTEQACQIEAPTRNSCDVLGILSADAQAMMPSHVPGFSLDSLVNTSVTLIKLDIEGGEAGALRGARHCIQRDRPKLCVCAYHRSDDLWTLMETVLSIRGDYKVGLRHYSDIVDDTTLYFY